MCRSADPLLTYQHGTLLIIAFFGGGALVAGRAADSPHRAQGGVMTGGPDGSFPELVPGPDWGEPRSRAVTWYDPAVTVALGGGLSGLEFMRALAAGRIPPPPIAQLLGMWPTKVDVGLVVFECTPD